MRLALWQGEVVSGDIQATLAETARVAAAAARSGADLLVFPEGFLTGYYLPDLAPGRLGSVEDALAEVSGVAARTEIGIVMGSHTDDDRTLRNAAVVFDARGAEIGRYYKRSLFGRWEKATFAPGRDMLLFDCAGLSVGVAICYDVEFPELIRPYAQHRADLVVVPTALMAPGSDRAAGRPRPRPGEPSLPSILQSDRRRERLELRGTVLHLRAARTGHHLGLWEPGTALGRTVPVRSRSRTRRNSYLRDLANL